MVSVPGPVFSTVLLAAIAKGDEIAWLPLTTEIVVRRNRRALAGRGRLACSYWRCRM